MLMHFRRKRFIFIVIGIICFLVVIVLVIDYFLLFYNKIIPKAEIISSFNKNYEKFESVQHYLENTEGDFYLHYRDGELIVISKGEALDIDKLPIKNELLYLMHKLHIGNINEYKGSIHFATFSGPYYFEQGVVYLNKADDGKYGSGTELIKDDWYYYWVEEMGF